MASKKCWSDKKMMAYVAEIKQPAILPIRFYHVYDSLFPGDRHYSMYDRYTNTISQFIRPTRQIVVCPCEYASDIFDDSIRIEYKELVFARAVEEYVTSEECFDFYISKGLFILNHKPMMGVAGLANGLFHKQPEELNRDELTLLAMEVHRRASVWKGEENDESFETFFVHFSESSDFQSSRIHFPLKYHYYDDGGDSLSTKEIALTDWEYIDFRADSLASQRTENAYDVEIILKDLSSAEYKRKGIDNGISMSFYFEKAATGWFLVEILDRSS